MPQNYTAQEFADRILEGDRFFLSRAITLLESTRKDHQDKAAKILSHCMPATGNSIRIGITGVPGVGKSTFIEAFGTYLIEDQNKRVAVLSIDPSSSKSKGSILGDKTRMAKLSNNDNAYIRPSASAGSLGGVAIKTRETILLCEAAGYDTIIVETVGVGQSETSVHSMVDFFLLLMLAGAGDELQGIKKGIMEMADLIAINKADGENLEASKKAKLEYKRALHLFPPNENEWSTDVLLCSALTNTGIGGIYDQIEAFYTQTQANGWWERKRKEQNKFWLHDCIRQLLLNRFYQNPEKINAIKLIEEKVEKGKLSPLEAAKQLLENN